MSLEESINCPNCNVKYRIPRTDQQLKITCKNCKEVFYNFTASTPPMKQKNKFLIPGIIIAILAVFIWFNQDSSDRTTKSGGSILTRAKSSNWVTIEYGGLVNTSTLTHSGETVGDIIQKIPIYNDDLKGLVQQYLEPYSILCHDVLLSTIDPDTLPLVNILAHYPAGSEQPAWVDLFREGHFQLYYNNHVIRVFMKGSKVKSSFEQYHSVIRHPIRDVINSKYTSIDNVEIYVFNNDYAKMELRLNTIPESFNVNELDLSSKRKSIDLASIEDFLNQGVMLEAIEVDTNNDLYFYGRKAQRQTLAGYPLSLSDIAVIYRSIFHYGNNAPYISLDKHEDNRYAKVNFGGHLENTHAGSVVLEADKLFKSLGTGIDPNTHELVKSKITKEVPDFLAEDERSLLEDISNGHTQIRYWFYPDSIGTVTDGSIGAIMTHQFLADVERMDIKVNVSNAVRKTIDHLNQNFSQYERAEKTFKSLSTVGRIMALINWLQIMNMGDRIELDELLSVKIPAFTTPNRTKKMLVVTAIAYPENSYLNSRNVRDYTKVYYISDLLDQYSSSTSDDYFLEVAGNYFSKIDISELAPPMFNELQSTIDYYGRLIKSNESEIESLENEIESKKYALNRYNSREVDQYNDRINEYNSLLATQESYINTYNSKINELNNMNITSRSITSIGGGINLRPSEFKRISRNKNAAKLREVKRIKSKVKTVSKIAKSGNWIRSSPTGKNGSRINKLPTNSWTSTKSKNGKIEYNFNANSGDFVSSSLSPNLKEWQLKTSVNGTQDIVKYSKAKNQLQVNHDDFVNESTGRISSNGKRVVFNR